MAYGVLEDYNLEDVPGTVLLYDEVDSESDIHRVKHGTGSNSGVILEPQPSQDPNDPLNWPQYQKDLALAILTFGSILYAATFGPLLVAGIVTISTELDVSIPAVAQLGGYQLLVVGGSGPLVCAFSRKYGKRPIFLASGAMGIIGTIIGIKANDYNSLLACRIVQGFATSAFESIVVTVIGDMYFVHQRGFRIALLGCALVVVSSLVSVITGPITTYLGWKYCFWILLPLLLIQFILMIGFCPESSHNREDIHSTDDNVHGDLERSLDLEMESHESSNPSNENAGAHGAPIAPRRKSFVKRLYPGGGNYSNDNILGLVFAPIIVTLSNIAALWTIIMSGLIVGWYVGVSFVIAQWFSAPPYNYTAAEVGYLWVGPAIGGLVAFVFMFTVSDRMIRFCAKRNKGIYEPEFRLHLMPLCLVFTVGGLAAYGLSLAHHWNPVFTSFILALMLFGIFIGVIASSNYILDGFGSLSHEVFVSSASFKNFFFYGMSYYVNDWIAVGGPAQMFGVFAGLSAIFILLSVPMYVYGKRYRSHWARHNIMSWVGLKSYSSVC